MCYLSELFRKGVFITYSIVFFWKPAVWVFHFLVWFFEMARAQLLSLSK